MSGKDGGWALPDDVHPPTVCYQIEVPNDPKYIAAFMGALWELQYWFNWQHDAGHTGMEVSKVWRVLLENIKDCDGNPVNTGYAGAGGGDDDPMIRQNPDNPCELQNSVDGVTWCTWADLSLCFGSDQPGVGAEQPKSGGGQACYVMKLRASSTVLVPTTVTTGDIITITEASGAGSDGTITWRGPTGELFVAGALIPGTQTYSASDPLPLVPHMALIGRIGSTYYPLYTGSPFTVPAGVANAQVTLMVNDNAPTDNYGDYAFKVCITNNANIAWSHTLSFLVGPQKFSALAYNPGIEAAAVYVLGTGWKSNQTKSNDGSTTPQYTVDKIKYDWGVNTTLTAISVHMNTTVGGNAGGATLAQTIFKRNGTTPTSLANASPVNGSNQTLSWTGSQVATGLALEAVIDNAGTGNTGSGTMTWLDIIITGSGFDPWA